MMKPFRELLSFWNEGGLILSLLLSIGYFGSRQALSLLPAAILILFLVAGVALAIKMAMIHAQPQEEYGQAQGWGDRALWYSALFLVGTAAVTFLGSLL
ncbi:MAG: hypothetical protein ACRC62_14000 [Microcoleus sp.]